MLSLVELVGGECIAWGGERHNRNLWDRRQKVNENVLLERLQNHKSRKQKWIRQSKERALLTITMKLMLQSLTAIFS